MPAATHKSARATPARAKTQRDRTFKHFTRLPNCPASASEWASFLQADYNRLQTRLNALNPGVIVTSFRNAPVFDFMNPSERINQIILSNLYNDQPFKAIPRVDRCTTCHQGIEQKPYQDSPQPFKTHPNLDLYISSGSPHPMETFGCTTCHAGLDRATSFQNFRE